MSTVTAVVAVYDQVDPAHLDDALLGLQNQERLPDDVVVVADGPLTEQLDVVIERVSTGLPIRRVDLSVRSGSGPARQAGIEAAWTEFVAIVDSDDVSLPARFRIQMDAIAELGCDVLGSAMEEFDSGSGRRLGLRRMPTGRHVIERKMRQLNPINHPTAVFRRRAVLEAGGYHDLPMLEDYDLCARMQSVGAKIDNLDDVLVRFRGGRSAQRRRRSREAFRSEWRMQRNLCAYGLISPTRMVVNWVLRSAYRVVPMEVSMLVYKRMFLAPESPPSES